MSQANFNPVDFLNQQVTGALDTAFTPCPAGEFLGIIEKIEARNGVQKKDPTQTYFAIDIHWMIDDQNAKDVTGRDKVIVRQGIMLDVGPDGQLDMGKGKNVGLGRLREAVGLNDASQPFAMSMLPGRPAKVKVEHETYKDTIQARVSGCAAL